MTRKTDAKDATVAPNYVRVYVGPAQTIAVGLFFPGPTTVIEIRAPLKQGPTTTVIEAARVCYDEHGNPYFVPTPRRVIVKE